VKVGNVLDRLREDGWFLVATKGSHRQFKHQSKPVGKRKRPNMRYAIVIEKAPANYAAYVPDLP
jgi:hypothetical protein